jgi:uncharacterized protein with PQ loop repeat
MVVIYVVFSSLPQCFTVYRSRSLFYFLQIGIGMLRRLVFGILNCRNTPNVFVPINYIAVTIVYD